LEVQGPRITREETACARIILPCAEIILVGQTIVALAGVQIGVISGARLRFDLAKGIVGVRIGDRTRRIGEQARATKGIAQVVADRRVRLRICL